MCLPGGRREGFWPDSGLRVIYISGPYRDSRGEFYVRRNIRRAEEAALFVWQNGGVAICPHKNTSGCGGALPDEDFLRGDLELLRRSDAVWFISGWQESRGARRELQEANERDIPKLFSQEEVLAFLGDEGD